MATSTRRPTLTPHCRRHDVLVNFAAESHVDRSIDRAPPTSSNQRPWGPTGIRRRRSWHDVAASCAYLAPTRCTARYRLRSMDEGPRALEPNSPYSATEGRRRSHSARYGRDVRPQQSRSRDAATTTVPYHFPKKAAFRCSSPTCSTVEKVPLYGEDSTSRRLVVRRRTTAAGVQLVIEQGRPGGVLQHRRRSGAVQNKSSPSCCSTRPSAIRTTLSTSSDPAGRRT